MKLPSFPTLSPANPPWGLNFNAVHSFPSVLPEDHRGIQNSNSWTNQVKTFPPGLPDAPIMLIFTLGLEEVGYKRFQFPNMFDHTHIFFFLRCTFQVPLLSYIFYLRFKALPVYSHYFPPNCRPLTSQLGFWIWFLNWSSCLQKLLPPIQPRCSCHIHQGISTFYLINLFTYLAMSTACRSS